MKTNNNYSKIKKWLTITFLVIFVCKAAFSQVTISTTDPSCRNNDGTATASVNGGTPAYSFSWSSGDTTATATGLSGSQRGTVYTVTVTDRLGCSTSASTLLYYEAVSLAVTITGGPAEVKYCKDDGPPTITLCASATGGTGSYIFIWGTDTTPCKAVSGSGSYSVEAIDSDSCTGGASKSIVFIEVDCSLDPNEIYGPDGYHEEKWVSVNDKMPYEIFFENDPEFATAPAQKVEVVFPINDHLNMFSFRLVNFGFGNFIFDVPANSSFYSKRLDVRDSLGIYVDVTAGLDVTQKQAFWIFESIDPATGLPPNDPHIGFLPINDSLTGKGEGFVGFHITPKNTSNTGDTVSAYGDITFDINDPLKTNTWTNIIDAVAPTSFVNPIPEYIDTTSFNISFTASDDPGGCGLNSITLYISKNLEPYKVYGEFDINDQVTITGNVNDQFRFFSLAKDFVNNTETMKTSPDAFTTITYNKSISGFITYDNVASTVMNDVTVVLADSAGTPVDTTVSDATGYYIFENVPPGTYTLNSSSSKTWGGGNATDALGIMLHFIQQITLQGLRLDAADVDASGYINSIDALAVSMRFTQAINSFAAGDWAFENDTVTIIEDHITHDFKGICMGDIDGSYVPPFTKVQPRITLISDSIINVDPLQTIVIPVKVTQDIDINAVSLILKYPATDIEILDLWSNAPNIENLNYTLIDAELRISWFSLSSFELMADQPLLSLKIKIKDQKAINHYTGFELDGVSELADNKAEIFEDVVLSMPQLKITEIPAEFSLSNNYPNPFSDNTEINYSLPEKGKVTLKVFSILGEHIKTLIDQEQSAGIYKVLFDGSNLAPGTYIYKIEVEGETQNFSESKNMVILQK